MFSSGVLTVMENYVTILHSSCGMIVDVVKDVLNQYEIYFIDQEFPEEPISRYKVMASLSEHIRRGRVVLCHPLDINIIPVLKMLLLLKPSKLAIIAPPHPFHRSDSLLFKAVLYYVRTVLRLMKSIGVRVLFVFTTPFERMLLSQLIRGFKYVYLPTYFIKETGLKELLYSDKPVLTFFLGEHRDFLLLKETIDVLEQLNFKPKIVVNAISDKLLGCLDDYRVICIRSDEYDQLIKYSTIIIAKTPSPETNNVIAKSIVYAKPVITTIEHGLALYFRETGLVFILDKWSGEILANSILDVLNNIDEVKKKGLSLIAPELKMDYGAKIMASFLK